jgi:SWI/SNF chromatin-remodeling complex subunit SWI1
MADKTVEVTLKVKTDTASTQAAAQAVAGVGDAAKKSADKAAVSIKQLNDRMNSLAETGEKLSSIGGAVAGIGAVISGPLLLAANSYIQATGRAEAQSRRWLSTQERIGKAGQDVGRVVVQQVLPYLEKAADLAEKAARFAEQHPEAIAAALKIGTVLAGLGAALVTVGQIAATAANIGKLYAAAATAKAAGAAGAAGAGVAGGAALAAGGVLAVGGAAAYGVMRAGEEITGRKFGVTVTQTASLVSYGLGSLIGKGEEFAKFTYGVGEKLGLTGKQATEAAQSVDALNTSLADMVGDATWKSALAGYEQFQKENTAATAQYEQFRADLIDRYGQRRAQAEQQYEQQRTAIVTDFAQQQARALQDFRQGQARAATDFSRNQAQAAAAFARAQAQADSDYYAQRALNARNFGLEAARMEADHQRDMRRMQQDYLNQVADAEIDRDATALYQATRSYDQQRTQAEEDYQTEAQRRNADYAQSVADQEAAFQQQRAQRAEEFSRQQAEAQAHYAEQRDQQLADFAQEQADARNQQAERLAELDAAYQEEKAQTDIQQQEELAAEYAHYEAEKVLRSTKFQEQLTALDAALTGQQATAQAKYAAMEADFTAYLNRLQTSIPKTTPTSARTATRRGGRAAGGYADYGAYTLGEAGREFVLNADTTRQLEGAYGGALTQQTFNSQPVSIQASFTGMGANDRQWFEARLGQFAAQLQGALNG